MGRSGMSPPPNCKELGVWYRTDLLKMAGSGYRRFARSRLYEYILVVMRFYHCI